jgi:hypothetical protein
MSMRNAEIKTSGNSERKKMLWELGALLGLFGLFGMYHKRRRTGIDDIAIDHHLFNIARPLGYRTSAPSKYFP